MRPGYRERAELFKRAILWTHEQGGERAVMEAFGDPDPIDEAWELDVPEFRGFLQERCREALGAGRGSAA
jgi:hypothetical protein